MIILKSKHDKVVKELKIKLQKQQEDYQRYIYYRSIAEQITMGEGVVTVEVLYGIPVHLVPQYYVRCLLWNEEKKFAKSRKVATFPTKYEANEIKDIILDNEVIKEVISQLKFIGQAVYVLHDIDTDLKQKFEQYEDLFCVWTENIEQILNEAKIQRED